MTRKWLLDIGRSSYTIESEVPQQCPDSPDDGSIENDGQDWCNRMLARLNAEGDIPVPKTFEELVTVEDLDFLRQISVKMDSPPQTT